MSLQVGELVPNCTFLRPDETEVRLSGFEGKPLVVIFLRHLA